MATELNTMRARLGSWLAGAEDALAGLALLLALGIPTADILLRNFTGHGIVGAGRYVEHLTLWVGFLGAMIAARVDRHLELASGLVRLPGKAAAGANIFASFLAAGVSAGLAWASYQFVLSEQMSPTMLGGWLPVWIAELILPISFAVMALRFGLRPVQIGPKLIALLGIPAAFALGFFIEEFSTVLLWPSIIALIVGVILGAPIFIVLGGAALLLFAADGVPVAAVPVETYRIVVSPAIPTIPLFTLTGYLLAEGQASVRLVRLFQALFAWLPGGLAIVTTLICAFFSTFTGASGVTILAIGGLLLPILLKSGYPERGGIGLLTSTGSIGLLFPPSLAVIFYGIVSHVPITDIFVAGLVPGVLMVAAVGMLGVFAALRTGMPRQKFEWREAGAALWAAKWELMIPVVTIYGIFGGFSTLTEAAAVAAAFTLFTQTVVHRDLHVIRDLPGVLARCVTLVGGVFVIIGVAMGFTNYLVDAQVPTEAAAWVKANVDSKIVFLLTLNLFLLVVGCLMDIFSAIVVVVPVILPVAAAFGIDPLHLAIIFLINLEVGYLTPPVGMNLFLAAFRFERPVIEIARSVIPYLLILVAVLILVTFVPALTLWSK